MKLDQRVRLPEGGKVLDATVIGVEEKEEGEESTVYATLELPGQKNVYPEIEVGELNARQVDTAFLEHIMREMKSVQSGTEQELTLIFDRLCDQIEKINETKPPEKEPKTFQAVFHLKIIQGERVYFLFLKRTPAGRYELELKRP